MWRPDYTGYDRATLAAYIDEHEAAIEAMQSRIASMLRRRQAGWKLTNDETPDLLETRLRNGKASIQRHAEQIAVIRRYLEEEDDG